MDRKSTSWLKKLSEECKTSYRMHLGFRISLLQRPQEQISAHFFLRTLIQGLRYRKPKVVGPFHLCSFSAAYSPCEGAGVYPKRLAVVI